MVKISGLEYSYGTTSIFANFDWDIVPGTLSVVTGANGSGKTTLLKLLSTLVEPAAGEISIAGHDLLREAAEVRRRVSCVLLNSRGLFPYLTVAENLRLHGRMHGLNAAAIDDGIVSVKGLIRDKEHLRPHQLSSGQRQCVHLAKGLMRPADLYLLDEPYLALDNHHIEQVNIVLSRRLQAGATIVLTAQNAQLPHLPKEHPPHALHLERGV